MKSQALFAAEPATSRAEDVHDFYVEKDGLRYAGTHLLIDLTGASHLADLAVVGNGIAGGRSARRVPPCLISSCITFLRRVVLSAVAILAESHMSIHTWPETGFAAVDIFLCGRCDAYQAISVLMEVFVPDHVQVTEHKRGLTV